jgi:hypothetical protein
MQKAKHMRTRYAGKVFLFYISILASLTSLVSGQETYRFERMWPTLLQPWYFNRPKGIAVGPDDLVYVVDTDYARIRKFTRDGLFITQWGREGLGDGEFGRCEGGYNLRNGIAFDGNGNVYVTDTINHRIQQFSKDGIFITKWGRNNGDGTSGTDNGEFNYPSDIAVDREGFVYVADYWNNRIQKFTFNGSFVTKWGRNRGDGNSGAGDGEFYWPSSVAVDPGGYIYVADEFNHRIQKFTADGDFMLKWDNTHPNGAQFNYPCYLTTDEDGNIYVTNLSRESSLPNNISKVNQNGQLIESWDTVPYASGIALDENQYMYVTEELLHRIVKLTPSGDISQIWASYEEADNQLRCPEFITVGKNGYVYTVSLQEHIQIFTSEGTYITAWGGSGNEDGKFNGIRGIAVDDNDNIYVSDHFNNRIQKFTPDGQFITKWGSGESGYNQLLLPEAIALDSSGNVYVTENRIPPWSSRVQKFTPNSEGTEYTFSTSWDAWDIHKRFYLLYGIAVGRDASDNEYVYLADLGEPYTNYNGYVHKFTLDGDYITSWTEAVPDDTFFWPWGLATDDNGNVYVADSNNYRVLKFNPEGELLASFGSLGSGYGQMSELRYIAVDSNEKAYVADKFNNRIQVFAKAESIENSRAIIVAGRGSDGNSLWDATQMCAYFAYRALTYQGFTKEDITYLSEDTDLDLDDNRISDDGIFVPSNVSLRDAIQDAAENNAENLVVYLTDHGGADESGAGIFWLSESETLTAAGLASMMAGYQGRAIVIIDACQSGSFMDALQAPNRIIITSTQPNEKAKFINQGTISFSNFFWTGVFNGSSIWDSYNTASGAVNVLAGQHPDLQYDLPAGVTPANVYIGNHVEGMVGNDPVIGSIATTPPELHLETEAVLRANAVTDPDGDGIARVWAVIWPPNFDPGSVANPLTDLPSIDLNPVEVGEGNYEIAYNGFVAMGIYNIAFYAMDRKGITSQPKFMTLSRNLARRAVIVAGGAGGELSRDMINQNASLAYNALISQRYNAHEINLMSPLIITPTVFYLGSYLEYLASDLDIDNLDLTIYLIGAGDTGTFIMNDNVNMSDEDKILTSSKLYGLLNDIQRSKQSRVTLIYDGNKSGSIITAPESIPPEGKQRIIITSTGPESAAYFKTGGSISFSSFFWDRIAAGATIGEAFIYAKSAISYCTRDNDISFSCYWPQHPLMDANGNGIASEDPDDYEIAQELHLGDGLAYADAPPIIGLVSVVRDGSSLTITAHNINSINPVEKVWAVIRPIAYCPGTSEGLPQQVLEQGLFDPDEDGTYAYSLNVDYACKVTVYAMSRAAGAEEPDISEPSTPIINQPGGDIYEDPDEDGIFDDDPLEANVIVVNHPSPQPHTFHHEDDADWVKFYGVAWENEVNEQVHTYTIEAGNLGVNCPVIEIYREDNLTKPLPMHVEHSLEVNGQNKVWFDFDCTRNGLYQEGAYYLQVSQGNCDYIEGKMGYDLKVYDAHQELTATVAGRIEDAVSGEGIDGAIITSTGGGATISTRGEYNLSEVPGNWLMTAREDRHIEASYGIHIDCSDQYIRQEIDMQPRDTGACRTAADCNDGRFCSGTETCINRTCQPGTPPCADDGIFCNGAESCNEAQNVCEHAGNPCSQDLTCDEARDVCSNCIEDAQCDDGEFCNGFETCVDGDCLNGTTPCPEGVECDEDADTCLMPSIAAFPRTIMQSRWMPLPLFMSIRGTNTHFGGVSKVIFTPPSVMMMPFVINQQTLFCMGLMMPGWITGQLPESIEISVTTNLEKATGSAAVFLMPFMLGEEWREAEDRIQ